MTWLVWRQHRMQFLVGAILLAAFAVLIVITGVQVANQYHVAQVACAAGQGCRHLGGRFLGRWQRWRQQPVRDPDRAAHSDSDQQRRRLLQWHIDRWQRPARQRPDADVRV